jgi:DNA modification methylase
MKKVIVSIDKLVPHPYHQKVYSTSSIESLTDSIIRTGNRPVYPVIVIPFPDLEEKFWIISGVSRVDSLFLLGIQEVEVIVQEITDETEVKTLIIDLNKQRVKSGREQLNEFRHYCEMYPEKRGIPGNRYSKIGKEMGRSKDRIKDFVMLDNFFHGQGDVVLEMIFGNELSLKQGETLKKVVEKYPEKFTSEVTFKKLCDRSYDFKRLDYSLSSLDPNDETDFELVKLYLQKDLTTEEFRDQLEKMGKVEQRKDNHHKNKVSIPEIDENYKSEHVHLIRGNNREVEFTNPFRRPINCIVGSPPYGNLRLNGDDPTVETGHNLTGREYGVYLSETYERYKQFMSPDGSIYVIIDDFRNKQGSLSCSLEHFVVEMERKGFYLVGRYVWWKNNPQPRSHESKNMVNGFEMVYRFTLDPKKYYSNPNLFIELEESLEGFLVGCTNTDNRGNTTRGGIYFQPNLKKPRNTLDDETGKQIVLDNIDGTEDDLIRNINIIRGNVQHPENYFRAEDEKRHTSTSPQYLTMTLIMESTKPGDLVVDIWNGVGGTMESSLVLKRDYIGVELEENYFRQTQRRLQILESNPTELRIGQTLKLVG